MRQSLAVIFGALIVLSGAHRARPQMLRGPEGNTYSPIVSETRGFDSKGTLFVLCPTVTTDGIPGPYQLLRWPLDGQPAELIDEYEHVCCAANFFQGTPADVFVVGDTFFIPKICACGGTLHVLAKAGSGPLTEVSSFRNDGKHQLWVLDQDNHLARVNVRSASDWRIQRFDARGQISEEAYQFSLDTNFVRRWWRRAPQQVVFLPDGHILSLSLSTAGTLEEHYNIQERHQGAGGGDPRPPRTWLIWWVFDPETQLMLRHGTAHLPDACFGSVTAWLGLWGFELLSRDSMGVSLLLEGGTPWSNEYVPDAAGTKIFLLRFGPDGTLLTPDTKAGLPSLRLVEQLQAKPVKRIIRSFPSGLARQRGEYRIFEIDAEANLSIRDFRKPTE